MKYPVALISFFVLCVGLSCSDDICFNEPSEDCPVRTLECTGVDSSVKCDSWRVEETIMWLPPQSETPSSGYFEVEVFHCNPLTGEPEWSGFVSTIFACGGHPVLLYRVGSRPSGARVFLDGMDTGLMTKATLCIREWWREHTVTVELDGHEPASTMIPALCPCVWDSIDFYLTES